MISSLTKDLASTKAVEVDYDDVPTCFTIEVSALGTPVADHLDSKKTNWYTLGFPHLVFHQRDGEAKAWL